MARLQVFRENSYRYALLIDPTVQIAHLSEVELADMVECLDYSRLSTAPRRKSQGGTSEPRPLVSNLPSPFFDDFLNLLPLNSSSRSGDIRFANLFGDDDFAVMSDIHSNTTATFPSSPPPASLTTKAATMPSNANSNNVQFNSISNRSSNLVEPPRPGSATRTALSQGSNHFPTSYNNQQQQQQQVLPAYTHSRQEPHSAISIPARSSHNNLLDHTSNAPSYLPQMTSPPVPSNALTESSTAANINNIPAVSDEDVQQRSNFRRMSTPATGKRPWYEQSQTHDDGNGAFGDQGHMTLRAGAQEGGMLMMAGIR